MPDPSRPSRRVVGVTVPLFSLRTARSWGIGDIEDLAPAAEWLADHGVKLVQILPLGEVSGGETSPYSALSAFGIDWVYVSLASVPELPPELLRDALGGDVGVALLERARVAERVDYGAVRFVKSRALRYAYNRFRDREVGANTERAQAFRGFADAEKHWLDDYALFRALKESHDARAWWDWEPALRDRRPDALDRARRELEGEVTYWKYLQWLAHSQWDEARARLRARGLEVMGDLPFMVGRDSADVWSNQREFRLDMNVGVPADQFDPEGQDWGLPPYNWSVMRANDFAWLRRRARYSAGLYDRFRVDHLVGFYRTYMRPAKVRDDAGKLVKGAFDPATEREQLAHGERVVTAMKDAARERSAELVAEDLGTVPDWVRASLTKLGVAGYKVLIWEKDDDVFRDPKAYPVVSVACFGTHDTDPVRVWWETRDEKERAAVTRLPGLARHGDAIGKEFTPAVHRALLELICDTPSGLVLLLVQDVLGSRERVNTPGTQGPQNWTYRLPAPVEALRDDAGAKGALAMLRDVIARSRR